MSYFYSASAQKILMQSLRESAAQAPMTGIVLPLWKNWPHNRIVAGLAGFVRKGSQIAPKGVADLLLEGRGHRRWPSTAQAAEPPQSPVFCGAKNAPR
jgi:hypothetical protein